MTSENVQILCYLAIINSPFQSSNFRKAPPTFSSKIDFLAIFFGCFLVAMFRITTYLRFWRPPKIASRCRAWPETAIKGLAESKIQIDRQKIFASSETWQKIKETNMKSAGRTSDNKWVLAIPRDVFLYTY